MAEVGTAFVSILPTTKGFGTKLAQQVGGETKKSGSTIGKTFSKGFALAGGALGGAAIVGGITKSINLAKDFDLTLRQVGIQTGQTGQGLKSLSNLALKMGADTAFSAKDAGDAMLELAKGGMTSAQIKAGALKTTMKLAAAGGIELGDAAGYVVQGMTTFGLKATQAKRVAIALAGGANASTADVQDLGQALSQVGPGAKNAGLSLEDTVATLSAFDNAGIKGSDAGTSLKTMLTRLVPATDKAGGAMSTFGLNFVDAKGNIDDIGTVAEKLKKHLGGLTQEQRTQALATIFGSDATRAASVLMNNGRAGIEKYIKATKNQATVQQMANAKMDGASGAWDSFTGSVETLQIKLGTALLPAFTKITKAASEFLNQIMEGKGAGGQLAQTFGSVVKVLTPIAKLIGNLAQGFGNLPGPVKKFAFELGLAALVFPKLRAGMTSLSGGFSSPIARAQAFGSQMLTAQGRAAGLARVMSGLKTGAAVGGMAALADAAQRSNGKMKELELVGGAALMGFSVAGPIGAAVAGGGTALFRLARAGGQAGRQIESAKPGIGSIISTLDQVTGAATRASRALTFKAITEQGGFTALNQMDRLSGGLAITQRDLVDASMGNAAAQKRVAAAFAAGEKAVKTRNADLGGKGYFNVQKYRDATKNLNKVIGVNSEQNAKASKKTREMYRATAPTADLLKHKMAPAATTAAGAAANLGRKSQRAAKDVHGVGSEIKRVPSKKNVDLNVNTHGSEQKVRTLREQMQALQDRTLHIRTITDKPHSPLPGQNATGTNNWRGGPTWVGEAGAEIVDLPRHTRITPNHKIHTFDAAGGGGAYALTITNWRAGTGYLSAVADSRVAAHAGVSREAVRARR